MPHRALIAQQLAAMYSTLSHPVRISIIVELRAGELCVNSLQDILGIRQSAVSQHLALLKSQRLIKERRDGRNILYRLASPELATWLIEGIPLIVPDDSESNLLKSAAQRAINHWSDEKEKVRSKASRGK
jgi:DNA-binding transcriptional ArsR family regulator